MERLNFHHLLLFSTLVREGTLVAAGRVLRLSHTTLSSQIRAFESSLGAKLVTRAGRRLVPTELGEEVHRHAEEIFALGREIVDVAQGRGQGKVPRLRVGIVDVLAKLVVRRLLQPVLDADPPVQVICYEESHAGALARLAAHEIDVVLADAPAPIGGPVRAFNHLLGTSDVSIFGTRAWMKLRDGFPKSLDGAPMLLPLDTSPLRRAMNAWLEARSIRPRIVAEFEDSALLKVIGQDGAGVFPAPSAIESEVRRQYRVELLGRLPEVREHFYGISLERRVRDPAISAIFASARGDFFARGRQKARMKSENKSTRV
jgi:LysR family transcriptional regulator, transcriptional activator of nhaA